MALPGPSISLSTTTSGTGAIRGVLTGASRATVPDIVFLSTSLGAASVVDGIPLSMSLVWDESSESASMLPERVLERKGHAV